jgi:tetratricopeptide (TPR) repeat protein
MLIQIEKNEPRHIQIVNDIYDKNYKDFVRLAYSASEGLFVECSESNKEFIWYAFTNYLQTVGVQTVYEKLDIPTNEKEAIRFGFKIIKKKQGFNSFSFYSKDKEIEVDYSLNGKIYIKKAKKRLDENTWLIYFGIENGLLIETNKLKKLTDYKEKAMQGEKFLQEAMRKYSDNNRNFKSDIKESIEEILKYFPDYYLGLIDYGNYSFNMEKDKNKTEYYFRKAININKNKGAGYAFLISLYEITGDKTKISEINSLMDKNLDKKEYFVADQNLISILTNLGKIEEAKKLLNKIKIIYIEPEFKNGIERLEKQLGKKVYGSLTKCMGS